MSKAEVELAIIAAQKHVAEFQPNPPGGRVQPKAPVNNHETSTRYIVIDPILRALGWDLSDPAECIVEYAVARRAHYMATRVDYVLKDATGEPAIVIEAKRIDVVSDDERALDQMDRYLQDIPTARVAVVTNGQYWDIAKREGNGWKAESRYPLGLHYEKTGENAQRLWDALSKAAVEQARAKRSNTSEQPPASALGTGDAGEAGATLSRHLGLPDERCRRLYGHISRSTHGVSQATFGVRRNATLTQLVAGKRVSTKNFQYEQVRKWL